MTSQSSGSKCPSACNYCRVKKAKCSGTKPCHNCLSHQEVCWYPVPTARKRKDTDGSLLGQFSHFQPYTYPNKAARPQKSPQRNSTLQPSGAKAPPRPIRPLGNSREGVEAPQPPTSEDHAVPAGASVSRSQHNEQQISVQSESFDMRPEEVTQSVWCQRNPRCGQDDVLNADVCSPEDSLNTAPALISPSTPADQFCGADEGILLDGTASYLPICTQPALDWVSRHIGVPDFASIAKQLTLELMGHDRERAVPAERAIEPDFQTAWAWATAYFETSQDVAFGIIDRSVFEQRLRDHYSTQGSSVRFDSAWYALRNTVYAIGCLSALSRGPYPSAFVEARSQAWRYFENALSVHTELIYARSGMDAVQVMIAMACFSEVLATPALEFMLVSNAVRLAQSKGLHLKARKSWKLSEKEIAFRNTLWWTIYSIDKHLCFRSGRPSAINDKDITIPAPLDRGSGNDCGQSIVSILAKHYQITSQVQARLSSAEVASKGLKELLPVVRDLDKQLREWHDSLPTCFVAQPPYSSVSLPPGVHRYHLGFVTCLYNNTLISIHTVSCYPWHPPGCRNAHDSDILYQRQVSTDILASASREIIVATQSLNLTAACGICVTLYFPLVGLINLFLHVIQHPNLPTTNSDISLMDTIVGHFGYLEYASGSELGANVPRKIVSYAREIVKRGGRTSTSYGSQEVSTNLNRVNNCDTFEASLDYSLPEFLGPDMNELGFEEWSVFFSELVDA
ncbi:uncharacterized protein PV06_09486 [Exophiala oligosperma]|uniref:Zn(2)-C6 fungal-type domain-containing protein n=1 Tax=Exophiala oligosperma TaxID=215243 RepID=A0A0D2D816_9EURO|nr:uncharacterized protein PV06_09486 [Exophiala oligosperma]KIW38530.1 hypothetical protein PV06_09486 [Exophiala oligosperma]